MQYIEDISFAADVKIVLETVKKVLGRKNVADVSLAAKDEEGRLHYLVDGRDIVLHRPLNIERGIAHNAKGNRQ